MPALQKVALTDFTERIKTPDIDDEFTALIIAINIMIDNLEEMVKEITQTQVTLEEKVEDRTKELQEKLEQVSKMNKLMVARELKMVELKKKIKKLEKK